MTDDEIIKAEIIKYFGSRYSDEYSLNAVTHKEFQKLKDLILICIEKVREEENILNWED